MSEKYTFRCNNCGTLKNTIEDCGDNDFPHSCRVCGKGVTHSDLHHEIDRTLAQNDPKALQDLADRIQAKQIDVNDQTKTVYPANWELLSEATPARLKELGLKADQVQAVPKKQAATGSEPQKVIGRPFRVFTEEKVDGKEGAKAVKTR